MIVFEHSVTKWARVDGKQISYPKLLAQTLESVKSRASARDTVKLLHPRDESRIQVKGELSP